MLCSKGYMMHMLIIIIIIDKRCICLLLIGNDNFLVLVASIVSVGRGGRLVTGGFNILRKFFHLGEEECICCFFYCFRLLSMDQG